MQACGRGPVHARHPSAAHYLLQCTKKLAIILRICFIDLQNPLDVLVLLFILLDLLCCEDPPEGK